MHTKIKEIIATYTDATIQKVTALDAGLESDVYQVILNDGLSVIVKRPKPGRRPNYLLEADAYRQAKTQGIHVPEVMHVDDSSLVMNVLPGAELDDREDLYSNKHLFRQIAEDLARCWNIKYEGFGPIDMNAYRNTGKIRGKCSTWAEFLDELEPLFDSSTVIEHLSLDALKEIKSYWRSHKDSVTLDKGRLVHGDFAMSAIFVDDGKYVGIIDFGDALIGDPLMDLAYFRFKEINKDYGSAIYNDLMKPYQQSVDPSLLVDYDERINLYMIWWGLQRIADCPDPALTPKFANKLVCVASAL